jgi:RHS repeat-associated protein
MATVVYHIRYDSFGKITSETNAAVDFLFAYTGRERDEETGLYYYRARYYDPAVGRFVSEDPLGLAAGDTNLVRYVGNFSIGSVDPTGENQIIRDGGFVYWYHQEYKWGWIKIGPPQKKIIGKVDSDGVVIFDDGFMKDVKAHQGVNVPTLNPMPFDIVQQIGKGKTYQDFIKSLVQAQAANPSNVWMDGRSKADYWQFRVTPEELRGLTPEEVEAIKAHARARIAQFAAAQAAGPQFKMYLGDSFGGAFIAAGVLLIKSGRPVWGGGAIAVGLIPSAWGAYGWYQLAQIQSAEFAAKRDYVDSVLPAQ